MPDYPFRLSCQAATQLGPAAADTILRRIAGKAPAPVRMFFAGQCLSLGRKEGVTQFSYPNDKVNALSISGRPGAGVKEIACVFTVNKLVSGARKAGSRASHGHSTDRLDTPGARQTPSNTGRAA
ncbi:hypothetical protein AB0D57_15900 [Streptomyces sp. NPDC048275]|uniref:hypothetical protein n=1 Tax=Streptomyces sp. NPDC048275 TaxID=3155629 RepID=UPI0033C1CD7E